MHQFLGISLFWFCEIYGLVTYSHIFLWISESVIRSVDFYSNQPLFFKLGCCFFFRNFVVLFWWIYGLVTYSHTFLWISESAIRSVGFIPINPSFFCWVADFFLGISLFSFDRFMVLSPIKKKFFGLVSQV